MALDENSLCIQGHTAYLSSVSALQNVLLFVSVPMLTDLSVVYVQLQRGVIAYVFSHDAHRRF